MTATVVHGAWHGAWCWDLVVGQLRKQAVPVVAIDLPGHGASTEDRAIAPALQRELGARCNDVIEWPTSHSPFASRPELVSELLVTLARAVKA